MKRTTFLTLVCAAGVAGASGTAKLLGRERVAAIHVKPRGDRQWLRGEAGACAQAGAAPLKWAGYTLAQILA